MFLAYFGNDVKVLQVGLTLWDLVEFFDDGSGGYKAGDSYFDEYADYYSLKVPSALKGKVIIPKLR